MRRLSYLVIIAAVCLAAIQLPAFAATGTADGPNLLVNGGMEGKYIIQCSSPFGPPWVAVPCGEPVDFATTYLWQTAQVPVGWTAWWLPPNTNRADPDFYNNFPNTCYRNDAPPGCAAWHNPEFRDTAGGPQTPPSRKVAGDNSQKYFTFYSLHEAGLYQIAGGLRPGQRVRFSVYMQAWSTQTNDPLTSEGQATMGLKVGIDPYGGNNPWSPNIVWSPVKEAFDQWELFSVETTALSDRVTVFTRSRPYFAIQHNDVYVDEASLVVVSGTSNVINVNATAAPSTPAAPANYKAGNTVVVGGTGGQRLILHTEPSLSSKEVGRVKEGARLTIVEGPRTVGRNVWWKVRDAANLSGWGVQQYLRSTTTATPTPTPRTTSTPKATTTASPSGTPDPSGFAVGKYVVVSGTGGLRLFVRTDPSFQAGVLFKAEEGTRLLIAGGPTVAEDYRWLQVQNPETGLTGWAAQRYLLPTK